MLENITGKDMEVGVRASDWEDAIRKSAGILLETDKIEASYVDADSHLELTSELAGILMEEENVERLVVCKTSERFLELLNQMGDEGLHRGRI